MIAATRNVRVVPDDAAPPAAPATDARIDAGVLALVALALRIPALLAAPHLYPDDGYYGMSVVAMRGGGIPYREVYSSQGPLHLPLLYVGDLIGLRTFDAPRVTPVIAGVVITVATYFIVRRLATRPRAIAAAVLVSLTGSILWVTGPITSDGPTLAFAALAFLAALRYRAAPSTGRAVAVALLVAGGVLVKPAMGVLEGIAPVILVTSERRNRDMLWGALSAAGAALVVSAPFGLRNVWRQTVSYQLGSRREQSIGQNVVKVATTLWERDVLLLGLVAATLVALAFASARRRRGPDDDTGLTDGRDIFPVRMLGLWAAIVLAFLIVEPALWRNHVSSFVFPATVLVALFVPWRPWVGVVAVALVPVQVVFLHGVLYPAAYGGPTLAAHNALEALPSGAWVLSDEVGLVWRAHRRTTDDYVDTSIKRQEQGQITAAAVARQAANPKVCGVLVWWDDHWGALPGLRPALAAVGYQPTQRFGGQNGVRVLYQRTRCVAT